MIYVDVGNTRIKIARDANVPVALGLDDPGIDAALAGAALGAGRALVACVASQAVYERVARTLERLEVDHERVVTKAEWRGLRCAYDEPARWGVDRFLNALAMWSERASTPFVVASAGTALAIDAVAADGAHLGGLIAPSPRAMRDAVLGTTARVRLDREGEVHAFGRNTEDGLASGCWHAAAALVDRAVRSAARELGGEPALVLTGGDAEALSQLVEARHDIRADLVLDGLRAYARKA